MTNYDFLYDIKDGVATITLNRPQVFNAITLDIYAQLRDCFEDLSTREHPTFSAS